MLRDIESGESPGVLIVALKTGGLLKLVIVDAEPSCRLTLVSCDEEEPS